jgi:hypothetical protein
MADSCEHGNEPRDSIKCGGFDQLTALFSFPGRPLLHGVRYLVGRSVGRRVGRFGLAWFGWLVSYVRL